MEGPLSYEVESLTGVGERVVSWRGESLSRGRDRDGRDSFRNSLRCQGCVTNGLMLILSTDQVPGTGLKSLDIQHNEF